MADNTIQLELQAVVIARYTCRQDEVETLKGNLRGGILSLYDDGSLTESLEAECDGINVTPVMFIQNKHTDYEWDPIRGFIKHKETP